jgi:hypothetical protein
MLPGKTLSAAGASGDVSEQRGQKYACLLETKILKSASGALDTQGSCIYRWHTVV